jgi:2-C-methyl-D-erythritol 4-phosphate cytidylyltransferase
VTPGDRLNFKITTPTDLALAEVWLERRLPSAGAARG